MHLHGDLTDSHLASDLLIHETGSDVACSFLFARRKRSVSSLYVDQMLSGLSHCAMALNGRANSVKQHLIAAWLGQEFNCSRLHGLDAHRNVAVTGHENNRQVDPLRR